MIFKFLLRTQNPERRTFKPGELLQDEKMSILKPSSDCLQQEGQPVLPRGHHRATQHCLLQLSLVPPEKMDISAVLRSIQEK